MFHILWGVAEISFEIHETALYEQKVTIVGWMREKGLDRYLLQEDDETCQTAYQAMPLL